MNLNQFKSLEPQLPSLHATAEPELASLHGTAEPELASLHATAEHVLMRSTRRPSASEAL